MPKPGRLERFAKRLASLTASDPRRALLWLLRGLILVIWARSAEWRAVYDLLSKATLSYPFRISVAGSVVTFPALTFGGKVLFAYVVPTLLIILFDAAALQPLNRQFPGRKPYEIPQAIETLKGFADLLENSLRIKTVYLPGKIGTELSRQPYSAPLLAAIDEHVANADRPIRILTVSGRTLIGDREHSLLWAKLCTTRPRVEVILLDPKAERVIEKRLRDLHNGVTPGREEVAAYQQEIRRTLAGLLERKAEDPDSTRIYLSALPYCMHLIVTQREVFCATVEAGGNLERSPWYRFEVRPDEYSFASGLVRVFETIRAAATEVTVT